MTPITPIIETALAIGVGMMLVMLFLAGWVMGGRKRQQHMRAAYEGGRRALRASDLARLRKLRCDIEIDGGGLSIPFAYLLYDVCQALRLTEGEMQHVVGAAAYCLVIDAPVGEIEMPTMLEYSEDDDE